MPTYSHVACCIDTGQAARAALHSAASVWGATAARISAVFVAPPEEVMRGGLTEWEVELDDLFGPPRRWLDEVARANGATPVLLSGEPPHEQAMRWLAESDADLAVAVAHNSSVVRAFLGSFAAELAYNAPVDTLILPPAEAGAENPVRHIACCVDAGQDLAPVLRATRRVADATGARVSVIHVVVPPVPVGRNLIADNLPMPAEREREARELLESAARELPGAETEMLAGAPEDTVSDHAESAGVDLLVVGPRSGGRPGLGGFASRLIRTTPCAVLLARGAPAPDA